MSTKASELTVELRGLAKDVRAITDRGITPSSIKIETRTIVVPENSTSRKTTEPEMSERQPIVTVDPLPSSRHIVRDLTSSAQPSPVIRVPQRKTVRSKVQVIQQRRPQHTFAKKVLISIVILSLLFVQ